MATFHEYKDNKGRRRYDFRVSAGSDPVTGKRQRIHKRGFATKKEAQLAASRLVTQIEQDGLRKSDIVTFDDAYNMWIQQYEHTVKESSFATTLRIFDKHILPYFTGIKLAKLTPAYCQKVINKWFNAGLKSYVKYRNYASKVLTYAVSLEALDRNPFNNIITPRRRYTEKQFKKDFYTRDELTRLFRALDQQGDPKKLTLFRVLAYTGMRKGECLALRWGDIDIPGKTLSIRRTISHGKDNKVIISTPKTTSSRRTIDLDADTVKLLQQWHLQQRKNNLLLGVKDRGSEHYVFTSPSGKLLSDNQPGIWLHALCKQINDVATADSERLEPIRIHGFRHTHASLLFQAGVDIKDVAERLGHSNIQTTMDVYTHVTEQQKKETAETFKRFMQL